MLRTSAQRRSSGSREVTISRGASGRGAGAGRHGHRQVNRREYDSHRGLGRKRPLRGNQSQAGPYEISAAKAGFATATVAEARLEARQTLRADFTLEIAAMKHEDA